MVVYVYVADVCELLSPLLFLSSFFSGDIAEYVGCATWLSHRGAEVVSAEFSILFCMHPLYRRNTLYILA